MVIFTITELFWRQLSSVTSTPILMTLLIGSSSGSWTSLTPVILHFSVSGQVHTCPDSGSATSRVSVNLCTSAAFTLFELHVCSLCSLSSPNLSTLILGTQPFHLTYQFPSSWVSANFSFLCQKAKDLDAFLRESTCGYIPISLSLVCPFTAIQQAFFNPSIMLYGMSHSGRKYHWSQIVFHSFPSTNIYWLPNVVPGTNLGFGHILVTESVPIRICIPVKQTKTKQTTVFLFFIVSSKPHIRYYACMKLKGQYIFLEVMDIIVGDMGPFRYV